MAEFEGNLKVKLFIALKKEFPHLSECVLQAVMKQCNNDKEKCVEELNKKTPTINSSMARMSLDTKKTDVSPPTVIHKFNKNSPVSAHSPELNSSPHIDFDPYMSNVPNTSKIPHITCKTSEMTPPVRQISVHHIQTSEVDPSAYQKQYSRPSIQQYGPYSCSPHNDTLHWPTQHRKNTDPLIMPTAVVSSPQHSTHANIYIEAHPRDIYSQSANMNKGRLHEYDPQVNMLHPVHTTTVHSPQPTSPYSPQSVSGNSPHISGQYINPKHSPSSQISQPLEFHPNDSPFKYQYHNLHGYPPPDIAINTKQASVIHFRSANNTYVHSINPSVSALPSQSERVHLPDDQGYINALLNHQRQRYEKLSEDYENLIKITEELSTEINAIQRNKKEQSRPTPADIYKLQTDIACMLKELDAHNNGQIPIGVLDPLEQQNFYKNMNTGQSGSLFAGELTPPPLPPRHSDTPPVQPISEYEGEHWNCAACTFLNHPALEKCEECEYPRNSKAP